MRPARATHDVHIRTILQTMPSVASGAVHVQQHGSRWLLFGNLGEEFDCVDTNELREEVAEAALRITDCNQDGAHHCPSVRGDALRRRRRPRSGPNVCGCRSGGG
jgi:hypothetical protein